MSLDTDQEIELGIALLIQFRAYRLFFPRQICLTLDP
jgi:hypothetical protein